MSRKRATLVLTACVAVSGLTALAVPSDAAMTSSAHLQRQLAGSDSGAFPGSEVPVGDVDRRGPRLVPLAGAQAQLDRLGRDGLNVSWTQYGTPLSVTRDQGFLATGLTGSPERIARTFLTANRDLFGLSAAKVAALQLVTVGLLPGSDTAWSVQFRQLHEGLALTEDGIVSVALGEGKVALVTSSLVPTNLLGFPTTTPKLSVKDAVLAAAKDAGVTSLSLGDLSVGKVSGGFTTVTAKGLAQLQRTRLRLLATTDQGARLVYETNITDVAGGRALAVIGFVDALTGKVLLRRDAVDTLAESTGSHPGQRSISTAVSAVGAPGAFQTTYTAKACSPAVPIEASIGDVTLAISAFAANPANDIVIKVFRNAKEVTSIDTLASPEAGVATFTPAIRAADKVTAKICPYDAASTAPFDVVGNYLTTDQTVPTTALPHSLTDGTATGPATYRAFGSNPAFPATNAPAPDSRYRACTGKPQPASNVFTKDLTGCEFVFNDGSPLPYDSDPITGLSTFSTIGNNAITSDARASSSLTPGGPFLPPVSPTRDYSGAWTDAWHSSQCDPASIIGPAQSDITAAMVNLNLGHNRTHDFAYRLGLTEPRGALQTSNFGKGGAELDPELGNAQNAALSNTAFEAANGAPGPAGGQVPLTGRNNANQITLQDGVPGITNQYLFQPIVGFAGACADGDLDASIFLHEYTHAISNRLIAGPDTGLSGFQGGSMGESWSDLVAVEYLNAFGLAGNGGEDPFSVGSYATGNKKVGIRDYNLSPDNNPLNYSDIGFDSTGPEVHADGEVWNAVQMQIRAALIKKYDAKFPSSNKALQRSCAIGRTPTGATGPTWDKCPGNRRYITYMFDAMINQANGAPSMVDMKNVELASIMLRDPSDWQLVADAFAVRGLGKGAVSRTSADTDPTPSFASPTASSNATVTFKLVDEVTGKPIKGAVYVGMYQARATAVASTLGGAEPAAKATMLKGTYSFTVQARGYGIQRFTASFAPGAKTQVFKLAQNVASSAFGPTVTGNAGGLRLGRVVDDSESTMAAFDGQPVAGREITVKFGGGRATFQRLGVSSLHHPNEALAEGGTEIGGRLLGIRAFDVQASSDGGKTFTTIYRSPDDFFPATTPRAVAPNLIMREIKLAKPVTADSVRLVIRGNNCTGNPAITKEREVDPISNSDCRTVATNNTRVTVTELQVLRSR